MGCSTFSLLNVVAYSLQKPLKIIIGYKKIIFLFGLFFCWLGKGFFGVLVVVLLVLGFFLADHRNVHNLF